jgi:hypothetical protein
MKKGERSLFTCETIEKKEFNQRYKTGEKIYEIYLEDFSTCIDVFGDRSVFKLVFKKNELV